MSVSAKAAMGHLPKPWCRAYGEALHRACNELESLISAGCPVCESADRVAGQFNGAVVDRAQDKRLRLVSGRSLLRHLYYWRGHGRTPECLVPQYFGPLTGEYRRQPRVKYYAVRGFLPIRSAFVKLKVAGALREDFTLDQFIGCFPSVARKLSTLAAAQAQHQKAVDRAEAEALGLIAPGQQVNSPELGFNARLEASTMGLDPDFAQFLKDGFRDQIQVDGDKVRFTGKIDSWLRDANPDDVWHLTQTLPIEISGNDNE